MTTAVIGTGRLAADIARQSGSPSLRLLDLRYSLDDPSWGQREYEAGHIAGAVYVHLARDLSGLPTGTNGRHPLPSVDEMARRFGALGIGDGVQVIAYDQDNGVYASRLWWMLRHLGHDAVAVLDGGFARWVGEGQPVSAGREIATTRRFTPRVRPEMLVTVDEVVRRLGDPAVRLIDARSPERYRGEVEPLDPVAGHIPGAVNRHYQLNVGPDGTFRPAEELRAEFAALIDDPPPENVIAYCGSGVTACHNLLAMEIAGITGARLYAGSWSEWCADPTRPVE